MPSNQKVVSDCPKIGLSNEMRDDHSKLDFEGISENALRNNNSATLCSVGTGRLRKPTAAILFHVNLIKPTLRPEYLLKSQRKGPQSHTSGQMPTDRPPPAHPRQSHR